jgi:hypothetical protein
MCVKSFLTNEQCNWKAARIPLHFPGREQVGYGLRNVCEVMSDKRTMHLESRTYSPSLSGQRACRTCRVRLRNLCEVISDKQTRQSDV